MLDFDFGALRPAGRHKLLSTVHILIPCAAALLALLLLDNDLVRQVRRS